MPNNLFKKQNKCIYYVDVLVGSYKNKSFSTTQLFCTNLHNTTMLLVPIVSFIIITVFLLFQFLSMLFCNSALNNCIHRNGFLEIQLYLHTYITSIFKT